MEFTDILYDVSESIATITFNRPEKLNAARNHTHDELLAALDAADADDGVRAVIITGTGRAFCSGTDLTGAAWSGRAGDAATGEGVPADAAAVGPLRIWDMNKPVIGALNGVAAGFGASILCSMDVRLAAEGARLAFIYARRGICNESCSSFFLPRAVGISRAMEWVATGRMVPAEELKASGFVRDVLPAAELLPAARRIAREIADNTSPAAVAVSRRLMWNMMTVDHPLTASRLECRGLTGLMGLGDAREGSRAFAEKRTPAFSTRPSRDLGFLARWFARP
ncbi:MAG: enoyl-CoA hydratase-related protein [Gammaproteobacteria bacterium]